MKRREFLNKSAAMGALSILQMKAWANPELTKTVGLQLYTLRDDIQKQGIEKILAEVSKLGYKNVENFGYGKGKFFGKTGKWIQIYVWNTDTVGWIFSPFLKEVKLDYSIGKLYEKTLVEQTHLIQRKTKRHHFH